MLAPITERSHISQARLVIVYVELLDELDSEVFRSIKRFLRKIVAPYRL